MAILINGMEMPKDCCSCDLCTDDGFCIPLDGESLWGYLPDRATFFPDGWKYEGCTVTEVPDVHGRLIDADKFKEYIDSQRGRPFIGCTFEQAMKILVDEQPTIIDAKKDA